MPGRPAPIFAPVPAAAPVRNGAVPAPVVVPEPGDDKWLTVNQAADYLGASRSELYRIMRAGGLGWVRLCGRRKVARSALKAFAKREAEQV